MFFILLISVLVLVDSLSMSCGELNGMQKDLASHSKVLNTYYQEYNKREGEYP